MFADRRFINVLLNGVGVMLAYAGMSGGAIIMPTIFKAANEEKVVFYGLIICNLTVVISGPFLPTLTKFLGVRISIVLSIFLVNAINNLLLYPKENLIYAAFFLAGIGNALLRVAALKFMTSNSTPQNLSRHSTIHWMMFTFGLMLGNLIVMLINLRTDTIGEKDRRVIAISMSALCWCGIPGYLFTKTVDGGYDEVSPVRDTPDHVTSFPRVMESGGGSAYLPLLDIDDEDNDSVLRYIKRIFRALRRHETLWLMSPMVLSGVYCSSYFPIIPTAVGMTSISQTWLVSGFGVMVGVGQLCGAFLTGKVVDRLGIRHISIINTLLTLITMGLTIITLLVGFDDEWPQWIRFSEAIMLIVGYFIGVSDMANNICLTVTVTQIYTSNSEAGFSLFIGLMSLSMVVWYILDTVVALWIILGIYGIISIVSTLSYVHISKQHYSS